MNDDWTSASFRAALAAMVRRRVPAHDVDDVVQAALVEAVASRDRPTDPEGARRWIWGVARHKVADYHRRTRREVNELPELVAPPTPEAERDLLRWAGEVLPSGEEAQRTFEWLLREGDGETLEDIANAERLPSPQVRQRVSRLRRLFKMRWAAQIAAAGLVVLLVFLALKMYRAGDPPIAHRPSPVLHETPELLAARAQGRVIREEAIRLCEQGEWGRCVERLNTAKSLDPTGDDTEGVRTLRQRAREAIERQHVYPPAPSLPWLDGGVGDFMGVPSDSVIGTGYYDDVPVVARRPRRRRALVTDAEAPAAIADPSIEAH